MEPVDLEDGESLRRAYVEDGLSLSAIAEMAGCSYASVRRALLAQGVEIRRSGPAPIPDLRNKGWLTERVREGRSAKDIAELLGCAEGTVRSALQWAGLAAGAARRKPAALADRSFLERAYVTDRRSVRSIAVEVGCSKDAVLLALRSRGVPIRGRGRSTRASRASSPVDQDWPAELSRPPVAAEGVATAEPPARSETPDPAEARPEPVTAPEPVPTLERVALPRHTGATLAPAKDVPPAPPAEPEPPAGPEPPAEPEPPTVDAARRPAQVAAVDKPGPASRATPPAPEPARDHIPMSAVTVPTGRVEMEIDKIETKTFPIVRRGYDRDAVDKYLRSIADDYRQTVRSAREAVTAARAAPPASVPATPPAPATQPFEDIGGRVTAVLTSAAEAAEAIKATAEKQALAIRQQAREETEHFRQSAAAHLAEAEQLRAASEQEAADLATSARSEAASILAAAQQQAARLEVEAEQRMATIDRTVRANLDAVIAEARRDYEHLRSVQQQCIDRLASVEFLAKHARDGMSEGSGQPIDELLQI